MHVGHHLHLFSPFSFWDSKWWVRKKLMEKSPWQQQPINLISLQLFGLCNISRSRPINALKTTSKVSREGLGLWSLWAKCAVLVLKKKSTWGVQYPNTSLDSFQSPLLIENGWNSQVVHHQEASAEKERQARNREAERDITDAPPQSLAFSYGDKRQSDFT